MTIAVVVERQATGHAWQRWRWKPVEVHPGVVVAEPWRPLEPVNGSARWLAASLELELHRKETEGYRYNLSGSVPAIYVVSRPTDDEAFPWQVVEISASPYDADAATEFGDDMVEAVPMPPALIDWVQDFVTRHHVDQPFYKRKRKGGDEKLGEGSAFERIDRQSST